MHLAKNPCLVAKEHLVKMNTVFWQDMEYIFENKLLFMIVTVMSNINDLYYYLYILILK